MTGKKGFTLIELLVVVAIIGILAAVGVVAYNGYTASAKASLVKQNHKTVIKFISSSLMKCSIGEELKLKTWNTWGTFFDTSNLCGQSNTKIAAGFVNHFTAIGFKNPYVNISHAYSAVIENPTSCNISELGYVCIIVGDSTIKIETEWKENNFLKDEIERGDK